MSRARMTSIAATSLALAPLFASCNLDRCGGICGCEQEETIEVELTIVDGAGPLAGIEVRCSDDAALLLATSDAGGRVAFSLESVCAPGCGCMPCRALTVIDPSDGYASEEVWLPSADRRCESRGGTGCVSTVTLSAASGARDGG